MYLSTTRVIMWRFVFMCCCVSAAQDNYMVRRPIKKCIMNKGPLPLRAEVDSCSNSPPPCILTNGQRVFIPIVFTVPRSTTTLKTEVMLYFTGENGILYDLPVEEPRTKNTCKYLLDATCPVRKDEILLYPFQTLIYEPNFDDGQQVAVEIMIYDNKVEEVMCLRVEFIFHQKAASPTILDA